MRLSCWRVAAVVGLSGLLLAAVPSSASGASRAADEEIADAGLLTAADFPAGWTELPPDTSDDGEIEQAARSIPSCKRYLTLRTTAKKQPRGESPEFELGESQVDNSVTVFSSTSSANAAMKLFSHPSVLQCINQLFSDVFEEQLAADPETRDVVTGVDVDIEKANVEQVGDSTRAYEGTVVLSANDGSSATIGLGTAAVRTGRAVAVYSYVVDAPEVVQLLPGLVDVSIARLDAALA